MTIRHPWLLALVFAVSVGLPIVVYDRQAPPTPNQRQVAPPVGATATPTPAETWRPTVKVDWRKYPGAQARIDTHGQRHDCDALADQLDAAWSKDRALAAYIDAWFSHSGLCHDAYYQKKE